MRVPSVCLAVIALALAGCGGDEDSPTTEATPSPKKRIGRIGNKWAPLFAAADPAACRYESQPACEQIPPPGFRKSFRDATVQDIVIKGDRAAAEFSNGEAVELVSGKYQVPAWLIVEFGGKR